MSIRLLLEIHQRAKEFWSVHFCVCVKCSGGGRKCRRGSKLSGDVRRTRKAWEDAAQQAQKRGGF